MLTRERFIIIVYRIFRHCRGRALISFVQTHHFSTMNKIHSASAHKYASFHYSFQANGGWILIHFLIILSWINNISQLFCYCLCPLVVYILYRCPFVRQKPQCYLNLTRTAIVTMWQEREREETKKIKRPFFLAILSIIMNASHTQAHA